MAHWFIIDAREFERAAIGGRYLSIMRIGNRWHWSVRQLGRDVAEGMSPSAAAARRAAEATARELGD